MNFLNIPNGGITGMRLYGNDLMYMQSGLAQGITAVMERFAAENGGKLIVSGCNFTLVSGSQYTISGGWVLISGVLAYFTGDTYTFTGTPDFASVEVEIFTEDFPIAQAYRLVNNVSITPLKRDLARLKTVSGFTSMHLGASNRLEGVMKRVLDTVPNTSINTLTMEAGFTSNNVVLQKANGRVFFNAVVLTATGQNYAGFVKIATLPIGYYPLIETLIPVANGDYVPSVLSIRTDGTVWFRPNAGFTGGATVWIYNISYTVV